MLLLKLIILSSVLVFFINTIFCFNRTVYILLSSLLLFLMTSFIFIFFEFEFLGLMFGTIYVGGIAVMFLFLILTVDVRVENTERVFIWKQMALGKIVFAVIFSVLFSFVFLYFCDPMMFASVDFYLYCNRKILFVWSLQNEPIYLLQQSEVLFSPDCNNYLDFSSLVYSKSDFELKSLEKVGHYMPFNFEFFMDYFFYNEYIDDVYTLGVLFFFYHYPLLVLVGLFLLVTTVVAVIICLNIFG